MMTEGATILCSSIQAPVADVAVVGPTQREDRTPRGVAMSRTLERG